MVIRTKSGAGTSVSVGSGSGRVCTTITGNALGPSLGNGAGISGFEGCDETGTASTRFAMLLAMSGEGAAGVLSGEELSDSGASDSGGLDGAGR